MQTYCTAYATLRRKCLCIYHGEGKKGSKNAGFSCRIYIGEHAFHFGRFVDATPLWSSKTHRRAHEVTLAEFDPAMAQDVIRRCAVEIEVRQDEILQQPLSRELALVSAEFDGDVLVLGAIDLRRLEGFAVVDCLGKARLELGSAKLVSVLGMFGISLPANALQHLAA